MLKIFEDGKLGSVGPPPFSGAHRITVWEPGTEVRFERPLGLAFFVRLPFALAVLAGPAMWIAMGRRNLPEPDPTGQIVCPSSWGSSGCGSA